jgi:hypothetical protein
VISGPDQTERRRAPETLTNKAGVCMISAIGFRTVPASASLSLILAKPPYCFEAVLLLRWCDARAPFLTEA